MRVVPLFETLNDLTNAAEVVSQNHYQPYQWH